MTHAATSYADLSAAAARSGIVLSRPKAPLDVAPQILALEKHIFVKADAWLGGVFEAELKKRNTGLIIACVAECGTLETTPSHGALGGDGTNHSDWPADGDGTRETEASGTSGQAALAYQFAALDFGHGRGGNGGAGKGGSNARSSRSGSAPKPECSSRVSGSAGLNADCRSPGSGSAGSSSGSGSSAAGSSADKRSGNGNSSSNSNGKLQNKIAAGNHGTGNSNAGPGTTGDSSNAFAGTMVGYCFFSMTSLVVHISKIAVHPACRRHGVGRALLKEAIGAARRERRVSAANLYVAQDNAPAVGLYEKMGFGVEATVADYYAPGRHALRMSRELMAEELL